MTKLNKQENGIGLQSFISGHKNSYTDYTLLRMANLFIGDEGDCLTRFYSIVNAAYNDKVDDVRYITGVEYVQFLKHQIIKYTDKEDYIKVSDIAKHLTTMEHCQWDKQSVLFEVTGDILNATPLTLSQLLR